MDRLKNEGEGTAPEIQAQNPTQDNDQVKAANKQKQDDRRKENEKKDKTEEGLLLAIDGAKIKFNAHLGTFKVLNDVPTTQDKLTGTVVEKQVPNFIFDDGFVLNTLTEWQKFGNVKVQDNEVLLKDSFLPGVGSIPGTPPESGKVEFSNSGQVNIPEKIVTNGAPVPEQKDAIINFIVYPRIWNDFPAASNYGFDWNRDHDDILSLRTKSKSDILDNCTQNKVLFEEKYESSKININKSNYYPPYLYMFKNHSEVTKLEVVLNLYVEIINPKKTEKNSIQLKYDQSLFDIGFTKDGKTIASKEFIISKEFLDTKNDAYFNQPRQFRNDKSGKPISPKMTAYEPQLIKDGGSMKLELSNLMIICKNTFDKDQPVKFFDSENNLIGLLIIKPNDKAIFSNKSFHFVKVLRKNSKQSDLETINKMIIETQLYKNGEFVKFEDENTALNNIVEGINCFGISKLLVNLKSQYKVSELEVDDAELKTENIISDNYVLKRSEYTTFIEKKINCNNNEMYIFFSGISENNNVAASYGYHKNRGLFYSSNIDTYFHELGHSFGLAHTFLEGDEDEYVNQLKAKLIDPNGYYKKQKIYLEDFEKRIGNYKKDLKERKPEHYPFNFGNEKVKSKKDWETRIFELEGQLKIEKQEYEDSLKEMESKINLYEKINLYNNIRFKKGSIDNIMEYPDTSVAGTTFYYQHEIIRKLNDEFQFL
ncbi:hypothetical protein [Chryseobacterium sp. MYb328]|uniref:hypothetical protein n=1 Tax=Chryseobacterium sp. MYb328 TaxID=2745231 RepID=UPI0030A536AE